jgi:signal transduction histidine kinase
VQLENAGLVVALGEMAANVRTLHGIEARFVVRGEPPACDNLAAMHLYRIAQEAVHNAVRHGKARHVRVALTSRQREHRFASSPTMGAASIPARMTRRPAAACA